MKKITLLSLLLVTSLASADYGLHFDNTGQIIKPDHYYLWLGIDDEKDGFRDSAFKNFKLSAEFGNYHAMSLVALYHMQDKDYLSAHAWFNLIDLGKNSQCGLCARDHCKLGSHDVTSTKRPSQ